MTDAYPIRFGLAERFGFGIPSSRTPFQALDFVRREGLPRPVIGKLGEGGAFLFEGGRRSTFIDGRLEVYSAEFIRRYRRMMGSREIWDEVTNALGVRTAVLKHPQTDVTGQILDRHPDWEPVYLDPRFVVFLKVEAETRELARRLAIDWATVEPEAPAVPARLGAHDWLESWPRRPDPLPARDLGRFFLARGELERSRQFFSEALAAAPGERQTRVVLALLARALGRDDEAAALLTGRAVALAQSPSMLALQAQLYEVQGRPQDALEAYESALAAGGGDFGSVIRLATGAGQPERTIRSLQRSVDGGTRNPALLNALGALYIRSSDLEGATRALRSSLELEPAQPQILNQLGILAARAGELR